MTCRHDFLRSQTCRLTVAQVEESHGVRHSELFSVYWITCLVVQSSVIAHAGRPAVAKNLELVHLILLVAQLLEKTS